MAWWRETLWALKKKYGITDDEITKLEKEIDEHTTEMIADYVEGLDEMNNS